MLKLVADLYGHIFVFLSSIMDWIMKKRVKRLLDSFNESFLETFEDEIKRINNKAERIRNLGSQAAHAEARVARLRIEEVQRDSRLGLEGQARQQEDLRLVAELIDRRLRKAEDDRRYERDRLDELGGRVEKLLERYAMGWLDGPRDATAHLLPPTSHEPRGQVDNGSYFSLFTSRPRC